MKTHSPQHTRANRLRYLIIGGICGDRFATTRPIRLRGKNPVQTQGRTTGGGAANVAVGLKRLEPDAEVLLVAATGDDRDGVTLREQLTAQGVTLAWGALPGQTTSRSDIFIEADTGHSTIFSELGARGEPLPLDLIEYELPRCDACWLVAPSRNDQIRSILRSAAGLNIPVYFGLGTSQMDQFGQAGVRDQFAGPVEMLICNRPEAERLTGWTTLPEQLEALRFDGPVKTVIVTDGENGIHAWQGNSIYHEPPYRDATRPIVDETGAGDAAQSVIGHWLMRGWPLTEALRAAARQGFEAVTALGATTRLLGGAALRSYVEESARTAA
jgi:fructokinase